MTSRSRLVAIVAALAAVVTAGGATAAEPPRGRWSTLYLRQEGCGETAKPGRLEPVKGKDSTTGCGTPGGNLLTEAMVSAVETAGYHESRGVPYRTGQNAVRIPLRAGQITGQLAARSVLPTGGGVGTVRFDVLLVARATSGKYLPFDEATGEAAIVPGQLVTTVPFSIDVRQNAGLVVAQVELYVIQRGVGAGADAFQLDGDSWISFPRA